MPQSTQYKLRKTRRDGSLNVLHNERQPAHCRPITRFYLPFNTYEPNLIPNFLHESSALFVSQNSLCSQLHVGETWPLKSSLSTAATPPSSSWVHCVLIQSYHRLISPLCSSNPKRSSEMRLGFLGSICVHRGRQLRRRLTDDFRRTQLLIRIDTDDGPDHPALGGHR